MGAQATLPFAKVKDNLGGDCAQIIMLDTPGSLGNLVVVAGCADVTVLSTAFGVVVIGISADVVVPNVSSGVVRPSVAAVYNQALVTLL